MSDILTITRKEFARFFSNKTTAFIALFFPGLLMMGMYTAMGDMDGMSAPDEGETFTIAVENLPRSVEILTHDSAITLRDASGSAPDKDAIREAIDDEKYDAYAVFPKNFDADISDFATNPQYGKEPMLVKIYYDGSISKSSYAYNTLSELLNAYETSISNVFDINTGADNYDLSSNENGMASILSTVLPMLILVMLATSIGSISAESIAGEKERGTIATLLATPIRRSSIVWGKLVTVTTVGIISTLFTIAGVIVGFSNLSGGQLSISFYSVHDYILLGAVLVSFSLVISVLMIIFSALAPTIRSAQIYFTIVNVLVVALALFVSMDGSTDMTLLHYFIPFYNTARSLVDVFACDATGVSVAVTALVNIALSVLGVFVAQRILNSERFMFHK